MQVIHGSWRAAIDHLHAPPGLDRPWLFTMDPYTYIADKSADDGDLHAADWELLLEPVRSWLFSGKPGASCVFCYAMKNAARAAFEAGVRTLNGRLHSGVVFVDVAAGQRAHVGAIISLDPALLAAGVDRWNTVRDS